MGYLDRDGLAYLWQKIKTALASKQDTITPGDGLSKDGNTINVDNPGRGIFTQAEFDVLPEAEKSKGTYFVDDGQSGGSGGEVYDDQERVIGTWFGKPLYQKVVNGTSAGGNEAVFLQLPPECQIIYVAGTLVDSGGFSVLIPSVYVSPFIDSQHYYIVRTNGLSGGYANQPYTVVVKYTKTTDPEVSA